MQARDILLFNTIDKKVNVSVYFDKGTFWLTQKAMADLFGVERSVITKHLKNIFSSNELEENLVCAKNAHTADDGKTYSTNFYRLEAILAVVLEAKLKAEGEYDKFRIIQDQNYESDFDKLIKEAKDG